MSVMADPSKALQRRKDKVSDPHVVGAPDMASLWMRAQALAAGLPDLHVRARNRPRATDRGTHGRRRAGPGDSFWQFRAYEPGESVANIDWRRSARTDALYVRQREWETAQNVWIWVDMSPSMRFRSASSLDSKLDRASILSLAAAKLLTAAGERVALFGVHERAAGGAFGMRRFLADFARERSRSMQQGTETTPDLDASDQPAIPGGFSIPPHAHLILMGDFLGSENAMAEGLQRLAAMHIEGHLLHIMDPAEADFPYRGRVRFEGLEGEPHLLLNRADAIAGSYRARMHAWTQTVAQLSRNVDWTYNLHRSDHSSAYALLRLIALMGKSG